MDNKAEEPGRLVYVVAKSQTLLSTRNKGKIGGKKAVATRILEAGKQKDVELSVQVTEFLATDKESQDTVQIYTAGPLKGPPF